MVILGLQLARLHGGVDDGNLLLDGFHRVARRVQLVAIVGCPRYGSRYGSPVTVPVTVESDMAA